MSTLFTQWRDLRAWLPVCLCLGNLFVSHYVLRFHLIPLILNRSNCYVPSYDQSADGKKYFKKKLNGQKNH